jgi:hypothetical protein
MPARRHRTIRLKNGHGTERTGEESGSNFLHAEASPFLEFQEMVIRRLRAIR